MATTRKPRKLNPIPGSKTWDTLKALYPARQQPTTATTNSVAYSSVLDAFARLERLDSYGVVSLVSLRRETDPATFLAQLNALRRAGVITLAGAEGRHGLTTEELAACVREGDDLLLYAMRRRDH